MGAGTFAGPAATVAGPYVPPAPHGRLHAPPPSVDGPRRPRRFGLRRSGRRPAHRAGERHARKGGRLPAELPDAPEPRQRGARARLARAGEREVPALEGWPDDVV